MREIEIGATVRVVDTPETGIVLLGGPLSDNVLVRFPDCEVWVESDDLVVVA